MRCLTWYAGLMLVVGVMWTGGPARAQQIGPWADPSQRFYADDPLPTDPDTLPVPVPDEYAPDDFYDFLLNTLGDPGEVNGPAVNVNTMGEVPNSSWYTNRHYSDPMSIEALTRGPNTTSGPSMDGPWKVVEVKQEGVSVGMQIVDARGDRYVLKFDAKAYPEMSTAAEVIVTKLYYAFGYHVPENYIARFAPHRLVPGEDATYDAPDGEERPITDTVIENILEQVYRYPDGTYRALASKFLSGKPVGAFQYFGTRPDDANDIFPHEGRRELRGLRVFSAWVNSFDARSANSLDMYVGEEGEGYVKHHLIDFGSTLGGGPNGPRPRWTGYEYAFAFWPIVSRTWTLGFGSSKWVDYDYPSNDRVGRFSAEHFDPDAWKPQYPNPAFRRADAADKFWAARQVMHLSDDAIRAIVATGQYSSPSDEALVAGALIARKRKIGAAYLPFGGGIDRLRVENGQVTFEDLLARYRLVDPLPGRQVTWYAFDNETGSVGDAIATRSVTGEALSIPTLSLAERDGARGPSDSGVRPSYLLAKIRTEGLGTTQVFLRASDGGYGVVGVSRSAE